MQILIILFVLFLLFYNLERKKNTYSLACVLLNRKLRLVASPLR